MEAISVVGLIVGLVLCSWKLLSWLWVKPKRLERRLREQGLQGTPYTLFTGDAIRMFKIQKEAKSKPINLSDDFVPRAFAFTLQIVNKYGKNPFMWLGPKPRIIITDPDLIKDVMNKNYDFTKPKSNPLSKLLPRGLVSPEGNKWAKHRRLINPVFSTEKLKVPLIFLRSNTQFDLQTMDCNDMFSKWEEMSSGGSCEMDVWPSLQNLTSDVISRTAFGSSFKEGTRIFQLLKEQTKLVMGVALKAFIPGWRFIPNSAIRRMKEINRDIEVSLKDIIDKREKAIKKGEATKEDLLGILLESNHKESIGMSIEDVIEECKLFYFAGQETTSALLVWTMVLLCRYPEWQIHAREEVSQVFDNKNPDYDGLNHLKIVTMILYEVLRLYPPGLSIHRTVDKDMKLGNLIIPAGVDLALPIVLIHHDCEVWGDDAKEFKPERFSEGVSKATKGKVSFFPFGWGPRVCIGQNFAMLEAKMALSMILQRFSFELSTTYAHAPTSVITLQPLFGAHIILHKI